MGKTNSLFYLYTVSFLTKIVNLKHNCRQRYKKNHHHYYVFNILYNNAYKMVKSFMIRTYPFNGTKTRVLD